MAGGEGLLKRKRLAAIARGQMAGASKKGRNLRCATLTFYRRIDSQSTTRNTGDKGLEIPMQKCVDLPQDGWRFTSPANLMAAAENVRTTTVTPLLLKTLQSPRNSYHVLPYSRNPTPYPTLFLLPLSAALELRVKTSIRRNQ